ncbi:hypothetical protein [Nonomuraea jabiensis]|uniref:hypothetical protein n=1 Tax=Nonomuraea jabiensis TaxID=882448 RepID=UPI00367856A0
MDNMLKPWSSESCRFYAPSVVDIGYLGALQMWFLGNRALQDSTMYGLGMLWWGRFGKIAAFLGGMTVHGGWRRHRHGSRQRLARLGGP